MAFSPKQSLQCPGIPGLYVSDRETPYKSFGAGLINKVLLLPTFPFTSKVYSFISNDVVTFFYDLLEKGNSLAPLNVVTFFVTHWEKGNRLECSKNGHLRAKTGKING